jgi:hypothetical protein
MIPLLDITAAPPVVCAGCGREIRHLFCLPCALGRLDDAAILSHGKDIRSMSKKPIGKTYIRTDCVICGESIPAGAMASLLTRHVAAHVNCVRGLRERLEEITPKQEVAPAGELPFGDSSLEVS